jgi:hypothetical protein
MSLVEISIVLGVIGAAIGGIWVVYSNSQQSLTSSRLYQQTVQTVKQVRDYYSGRALPSGAIASGTFTNTLRTGGIFAEDMCPADCVAAGSATVYNALGGTATASVPATSNQFDLDYTGVSARACLNLGMQLSSRADETGLVSFKVNSHSTITTFPISLSTLTSDCDDSGNSNDITITFKIRN